MIDDKLYDFVREWRDARSDLFTRQAKGEPITYAVNRLSIAEGALMRYALTDAVGDKHE